MVDFMSSVTSSVVGWMSTGIFWLAFFIVAALALWGGLVLRKRRKLNKPVLELYDVGQIHWKYALDKDGQYIPVKGADGKMIWKVEPDWDKSAGIFEFDLTKGGWFKKKFTLFGLWDYGNESLFRLKDMTPIHDVSHNDYVRVNGKLGLVVIRVPNDPKFAVPISKFYLSYQSKLAMAEIAPVDLRNASVDAMEQADVEMKAKWEKIMPYIFAGLILIGLVISIMFITQYGKYMVDKAGEILKSASEAVGRGSVIPSTVN